MDVYYLSIAYLSTMRNWTSDPAFRIGQFLFYYRLVGTALFELIGARVILLIFPNTFEYYFIAYEAVRLRWKPALRSARTWALVAAFIWIFIKLPQEYWIHVAQLDFTDTMRAHPGLAVAIVVALIGLAVAAVLLRHRLPPAEHPLRWEADPLPAAAGVAPASPRPFLSTVLLEKIVLLALISVIFSQFLPSVSASPLEVVLGVVVVVSLNTLLSTRLARRGDPRIESHALRFAALVALNTVLVLGTALILGGDTDIIGTALFFGYLVSLILTLFDAFRPVYDVRFPSEDRVASVHDLVRRVRMRVP
jgi:hypothetical protein